MDQPAIAIIGMGCVFPYAFQPESLWQRLLSRKKVFRAYAPAEPQVVHASNEALEKLNPSEYWEGGFIDDFDPYFRAHYDLLTANEVGSTLSKEGDKWLYHATKTALDEGRNISSAKEELGMVLGVMPMERRSHIWKESLGISYIQKIDAASASSLYAIRLACERIWNKDVKQMLAGAINDIPIEQAYRFFSTARVYAKNNRPFIPLDKQSKGIKVSHGAAVVLLKLWEDAVNDGDVIHAVIQGQGWSNDGKGKHFFSPNSKGQLLALDKAYEASGISPTEVSYLECHASGTPKGDKIELESIDTFFSSHDHLPLLGSVKGQLGHTLSTAGMASLVKIILNFKHHSWTASHVITDLHETVNTSKDLILSEPEPWKGAHKIVAGINAFGFGGVNAHLIVSTPEFQQARVHLPLAPVTLTQLSSKKATSSIVFSGLSSFCDKKLPKDDPSWDQIPPVDKSAVSPLQKLMLKVASEALFDAGWDKDSKEKQNVGVMIIGEIQGAAHLEVDISMAALSSFLPNLLASRISARYNFSGPALVLDLHTTYISDVLRTAESWLRSGEVSAVVLGLVTKEINIDEPRWKAKAMVLEEVGEDDIQRKNGYALLEHLTHSKEPNPPFLTDPHNTSINNSSISSLFDQLFVSLKALTYNYLPPREFVRNIISPALPDQQLPWITRDKEHRKLNLTWKESHSTTIQLVLREYSEVPRKVKCGPKAGDPVLIPVSGNGVDQLLEHIEQLSDELSQSDDLALVSFRYLKNYRPDAYTISFVGKQGHQLQRDITSAKEGIRKSIVSAKPWITPSGSYFTPSPLYPEGKIVFVYPGSASGYPYMAKGLFERYPDIWAYLRYRVSDISAVLPSSYLYPMEKGQAEKLFEAFKKEAIPMISAGVVLSSMYTYLMKEHFHLEPDMVLGYSMGETTTMWYALEVWDSYHSEHTFIRSPLFRKRIAGNMELLSEVWNLPAPQAKAYWKSYLIFSPVAPLQEKLRTFSDKPIYLSFINTPEECVISGDQRVCESFLATLNMTFIPLDIHNLAHHDFVRKEWDLIVRMHTNELLETPDIPFYSSISGEPLPLIPELIAKNSAEVCCQEVNFPKVIQSAYGDGGRIFIELGTDAHCTRWIQDILRDSSFISLSLNKKGVDDQWGLMKAMAILLSHKVPMRLDSLFPSHYATPFSIPLRLMNSQRKKYVLNEEDIKEFAEGDIVKSLGKEFLPFRGRRYARQPNGSLALMSRVRHIRGARFTFDQTEKEIFSEYDVPSDAWYISDNAHPHVPYAILMEIALQPCGMIAAYMGCILQYPEKDLFFRNLDGAASLSQLPDLRGTTIYAHAILTSCIFMGGTIILHFSFRLMSGSEEFFEGTASFGFFPEMALKHQAGLDKEGSSSIWYQEHAPRLLPIPLSHEAALSLFYTTPSDESHLRMKKGKLNLLHEVRILPEGGIYGKGYVHGIKHIDPMDWYFKNHFKDDPVMPGSLGIEAMIQGLKLFVLRQRIGDFLLDPVIIPMTPHHTSWKYRGQILPDHELMQVEMHIQDIQICDDKVDITAEGHLFNDQQRIYEVKQLGISVLSNPFSSHTGIN